MAPDGVVLSALGRVLRPLAGSRQAARSRHTSSRAASGRRFPRANGMPRTPAPAPSGRRDHGVHPGRYLALPAAGTLWAAPPRRQQVAPPSRGRPVREDRIARLSPRGGATGTGTLPHTVRGRRQASTQRRRPLLRPLRRPRRADRPLHRARARTTIMPGYAHTGAALHGTLRRMPTHAGPQGSQSLRALDSGTL